MLEPPTAMPSMTRRVAIVTGAARGLGRAMAIGLAEAGLDVVAVCRPRGPEFDPADDQGELPIGNHLIRVDGDVTVVEDCERAVAAARERFGGLDVLVNNAAMAHDRFVRFHASDFGDVDVDLWRRLVDVNVNGTFLMTRSVASHLTAQGWGRIVNISTSMSSMLNATVLPYGASKAAVAAMTVGWAGRLAGTGVTVNEVLPGGPTGPRTPGKHWWRAEDSVWPADTMVPPLRWLASERSDGVTGRRFIARLWDPTLSDAEAAVRSGRPGGWPVPDEEVGTRPPS